MMLELAVPVVSALDGAADGGAPGVNPRAAMALFLVAAVHCALMAMLLRVAGTTVAGWTVFGLGNDPRGASGENAAMAAASAVAAGQPLGAAPAMASATGRSPIQVTPPAAAAATSAGPASGSRSTTTIVSSVAGPASGGLPAATPHSRTRGIGNRFAAPRRASSLRETR